MFRISEKQTNNNKQTKSVKINDKAFLGRKDNDKAFLGRKDPFFFSFHNWKTNTQGKKQIKDDINK